LKDKSAQRKTNYTTDLIFKQLLRDPLLELDDDKRKAYYERVMNLRKGDEK